MNRHHRWGKPPRRRRGTAFMLALFVTAVSSMVVVAMLDTQTLQYAALRNTIDFDRARYLAEAGICHALSILEQDFSVGEETGFSIAATEFPAGSGHQYTASVGPVLSDGTRTISATGTAGGFTRSLQTQVKMGG
jgi:Tfp pilus assembly protein PilX